VRRMKKSTKRRKRAEAQTEAMKIEAAALKGGTATDETASKAYAILAEAAEAAARGELSEGRARDLLARLSELSTGQALRFFTVAEWRDEWLAMKGATSKQSTLRRYKGHVDDFVEWLGDKATARLEAVTKADIRGFRDAIRSGWTGKANDDGEAINTARTAKTTNLYAADVASMFRAAMKDGLILANPAAALERLPELDSAERDVFTVAEVGKLVNAAGNVEWQAGMFAASDTQRGDRCADWQGMILLGFYAGARLGDCARMKW
jgi:integrase